MAHSFSTYFCKSDFNTTFFTNNTPMLHALIFTAQALVVFDWAKYLGAEETFPLGLKGAVVYRLRLFNFTK